MRLRIIFILLIGIMAVSCMSVTGCSSFHQNKQTESEIKQETDSNLSVSSEVENAKSEKTTNSVSEKQDSEMEILDLSPNAVAYFDTTYGDFLNNGGSEAEFLHGGRYIAECPDMNAEVVYEGIWHEATADFSIEATSVFLRLEGKTSTLFTGIIEELTAEDFLKPLELNYTVASEYRESAGTAYYVSNEDYLHVELEAKDDTRKDAVIEIACKKGEKITPNSYCWVMEKKEQDISFSDIPSEFEFSSGAGGWATIIDISEDGSFDGQYFDSDMGDVGEGYPNGTQYICNFSGKFSDPQPTDKKFIYSMKLMELNVDDQDKIGTEEIVDETLYVYSSPYGFEKADEFLIFIPGASLSDMTEECLSWIFVSDSIFKEIPDGYYVIYNVGGQEAFTRQIDDSIWNRSYKFEKGNAYADFSPSYYVGSHLSFFTERKTPAKIFLSVPWDGKNSGAMECYNTMDDDKTMFSVTIKPIGDSSLEVLEYAITVECTSNPNYDFSPWGSGDVGRFSAVFYEKKE